MISQYVVGVDIGGSHITAAVTDMQQKCLLRHTLVRQSLYTQAASDQIFDAWAAAIRASLQLHGQAVHLSGIAMPGPVDYTKGICYIRDQQKYDALYGLNLKEALSARLHIPAGAIYMANDAACFMQGEADGGAGTGSGRLLGFTLGTGFGSARFHGSFAADADLWHRPFRNRIAEEFFSTRWFVAESERISGKQYPDVRSIVQALPQEPMLKELFTSFGRNFGIFLSELIAEEKPDRIILGGNIAHSYAHFRDALIATLDSAGLYVPVRLSELGEEATLLGAASFAQRTRTIETNGIQKHLNGTIRH
jgi:glucokinase